MEKYFAHRPLGTRDYFGDDANSLLKSEAWLLNTLISWDFQPLISPVFEKYEVLNPLLSPKFSDQCFKMIDPLDGDFCILRPDITPQAACFISNHLKDLKLPIKICYKGRLFRQSEKRNPGQKREVFQVGAEIFGNPESSAEIELISIAKESLSSKSLLLEISYPAIFKTMVDLFEIPKDQRENLFLCFESKNSKVLDSFLTELGLKQASRDCIKKVSQICSSPTDLKTHNFDYLPSPLKLQLDFCLNFSLDLESLFPDLKIMVDFGNITSIHYYSGLLFRFFDRDSGAILAAGGRYDSLMDHFNIDLAACGIAFDIGELNPLNSYINPLKIGVEAAPFEKLKLKKEFEKAGKDIIFSSSNIFPKLTFLKEETWSFFNQKNSDSVELEFTEIVPFIDSNFK